jgi:hypothetical protein
LPSAAWSQPATVRTRYLPSLTNPEIEHYLKRNDIIFIPVGTVETFGAMPSDMEYRMLKPTRSGWRKKWTA